MLTMFLGIVILPMGLLPKECFSWILAMEFHLWKAALIVQVSATHLSRKFGNLSTVPVSFGGLCSPMSHDHTPNQAL